MSDLVYMQKLLQLGEKGLIPKIHRLVYLGKRKNLRGGLEREWVEISEYIDGNIIGYDHENDRNLLGKFVRCSCNLFEAFTTENIIIPDENHFNFVLDRHEDRLVCVDIESLEFQIKPDPDIWTKNMQKLCYFFFDALETLSDNKAYFINVLEDSLIKHISNKTYNVNFRQALRKYNYMKRLSTDSDDEREGALYAKNLLIERFGESTNIPNRFTEIVIPKIFNLYEYLTREAFDELIDSVERYETVIISETM